MQATLTLSTPLPRRLWAWAQERFPAPNVIVSALFFACALLCGRHAAGEAPVVLSTRDLLGVLAGVGFFLMLRVFDEHKDYDDDVKNYPERVLSRGLVTLDQLKLVGLAAVSAQLLASLAADGGLGRATYAWAVVLIYSLLMLKEFFIHDWLKPRLVAYAASHMLVTPLAMLWFFLMGAHAGALGRSALFLVVLSYAAGAAFELTRKMRGPEEERPEVDSYTKSLGLGGSVTTLCVALSVVAASELALLYTLGSSWVNVVAAATLLAFVPSVLSLASFARAPSEAGRKRNENAVGLVLLACHIAPIVVVLQERGVAWQP